MLAYFMVMKMPMPQHLQASYAQGLRSLWVLAARSLSTQESTHKRSPGLKPEFRLKVPPAELTGRPARVDINAAALWHGLNQTL